MHSGRVLQSTTDSDTTRESAGESGSAAAELAPGSLRCREAGCCGHFHIPGSNPDLYERFTARLGFPGSMDSEQLAHFVGLTGDALEVVDFWSQRSDMERVLHEHGAALSEIIASAEYRPDVEPEARDVARLIVGPAADGYTYEDVVKDGVHAPPRPVTAAAAAIEEIGGGERRYMEACARLGFPERLPEGLVVHAACDGPRGWHVFDCFATVEQLADWHARVGEVLTELNVESREKVPYAYRKIALKNLIVRRELCSGGRLPT